MTVKTSKNNNTINFSDNVFNSFSKKDIISLMYEKSISKMEYYKSKCRTFEIKYKQNFNKFKNKIEKQKHENFNLWDDFLLWEGFEEAYKEWEKKSEELIKCLK